MASDEDGAGLEMYRIFAPRDRSATTAASVVLAASAGTALSTAAASVGLAAAADESSSSPPPLSLSATLVSDRTVEIDALKFRLRIFDGLIISWYAAYSFWFVFWLARSLSPNGMT